jgi:hypothetical protein
MDFDHALERAKARFEDWRALVVLDDKPLRRYVMCWRPCLVRRLTDWPPRDDIASLWGCVDIDLQALCEMTGDALPDVQSRLRQAQGMELIYPDGSVAQAVARVLKGKLAEIKGM